MYGIFLQYSWLEFEDCFFGKQNCFYERIERIKILQLIIQSPKIRNLKNIK